MGWGGGGGYGGYGGYSSGYGATDGFSGVSVAGAGYGEGVLAGTASSGYAVIPIGQYDGMSLDVCSLWGNPGSDPLTGRQWADEQSYPDPTTLGNLENQAEQQQVAQTLTNIWDFGGKEATITAIGKGVEAAVNAAFDDAVATASTLGMSVEVTLGILGTAQPAY